MVYCLSDLAVQGTIANEPEYDGQGHQGADVHPQLVLIVEIRYLVLLHVVVHKLVDSLGYCTSLKAKKSSTSCPECRQV